jgi:hypothetical protein
LIERAVLNLRGIDASSRRQTQGALLVHVGGTVVVVDHDRLPTGAVISFEGEAAPRLMRDVHKALAAALGEEHVEVASTASRVDGTPAGGVATSGHVDERSPKSQHAPGTCYLRSAKRPAPQRLPEV